MSKLPSDSPDVEVVQTETDAHLTNPILAESKGRIVILLGILGFVIGLSSGLNSSGIGPILICGFSALVIVGGIILKVRPSRRFRFSIRTLLIMVTLLSVGLGWVGWELDQRRREKEVAAWVEEMGGSVDFPSSSETDKRSWWDKTKDKWFAERVQLVNLSDTQVSDLSPLADLKNLKWLRLHGTQVSDLSPLAELKNLERLYLDGTEVSDLSPLAELKNLETLYLYHTEVSDLSPLAELSNLEELGLNGTQVSEEQVQELRQALPNCEISF